MFNFLKICGKGILAILLSPFWLSAFILAAVFGLIFFIFNSFRILIIDLHNVSKANTIDPLGELPEDLEVLRIKKANEASLVQNTDSNPAPVVVAPVVSQAPTIAPSPIVAPIEEKVENEESSIEEDNLSTDKEENES